MNRGLTWKINQTFLDRHRISLNFAQLDNIEFVSGF